MLDTICFRLSDELGEWVELDLSTSGVRFINSREVFAIFGVFCDWFMDNAGGGFTSLVGLEKYCFMSFIVGTLDKGVFFALVYFGVFFEVTSADDARTK